MFISVYKGKWVKTQLPIEKIKKKNKKKIFFIFEKVGNLPTFTRQSL